MADARRELYKTLDALDYHTRKITALTTEARVRLLEVGFPPPKPDPGSSFSCSCGAVFLLERNLALHVQNQHDGPAVPLSDAELAG